MPVLNNADQIRALGYEVIEDSIVTIKDMVRHNSRRISKIILDTIQTHKRRLDARPLAKRRAA